MTIQKVTVLSDLGVNGIRDFGGQGSLKYVHPMTMTEIYNTPEFAKSLEYVKALGRIKRLLTQTIKTVPLTNRGTLLKALQFEMKKHDFDFPVMNLKLSSVAEEGQAYVSPALEYLDTKRQTLLAFSFPNRKLAIEALKNV
jgi:hypothetical protein